MNSSVFVVVGLSFGDEGKGSLTDYLVRKHGMHTVVRFNGGSQAGHNVVLADGRQHTFAQFGSGAFAGCRTHLSRYMLVNPQFLMNEERHLQELGFEHNYARLTVERTALVTTPFQVAANRLREMLRAEGTGRHGSCGMGIGETMADWVTSPADSLRIEDLEVPTRMRCKLTISQIRKRSELEGTCGVSTLTPAMEQQWAILTDPHIVDVCVENYEKFAHLATFVDDTYLATLLSREGGVIFEGAQGVLLDQDWGFFPHVTRTSTTIENARVLIDHFADGRVKKLGLMRAYATRHGPGPFPTEDASLQLPDSHNCFGEWQRSFRVGHLDVVAARYALQVIGGVDEIVMTCVDRVEQLGRWKLCVGYQPSGPDDITRLSPPRADDLVARAAWTAKISTVTPIYEAYRDLDEFIRRVEELLETPVRLCSYGPTAEDKRPRC